jgi:hypothetical protein
MWAFLCCHKSNTDTNMLVLPISPFENHQSILKLLNNNYSIECDTHQRIYLAINNERLEDHLMSQIINDSKLFFSLYRFCKMNTTPEVMADRIIQYHKEAILNLLQIKDSITLHHFNPLNLIYLRDTGLNKELMFQI